MGDQNGDGNGWGGKREGAGRKRKAEKYAGRIAEAEDRIADRLAELVDAAFVLAKGVAVEAPNGEGELEVFRKPPCIKAIMYLVDRIAGKPTQAVELTGEEGGPIEIVRFYLPSNGRDGSNGEHASQPD